MSPSHNIPVYKKLKTANSKFNIQFYYNLALISYGPIFPPLVKLAWSNHLKQNLRHHFNYSLYLNALLGPNFGFLLYHLLPMLTPSSSEGLVIFQRSICGVDHCTRPLQTLPWTEKVSGSLKLGELAHSCHSASLSSTLLTGSGKSHHTAHICPVTLKAEVQRGELIPWKVTKCTKDVQSTAHTSTCRTCHTKKM